MVQEALLRIFAKGISQRKDGNTLISVSSSWDHGCPDSATMTVRRSTWGRHPVLQRIQVLYEMFRLAIRGRKFPVWLSSPVGGRS